MGPTQPPVQRVPGLSRGSSGGGVVLTTHPLLAARSRMSRAIPLLPLSGPSLACYRVTFTFYTVSKTHPFSYPIVPEALLQGTERPARKYNHSPPPAAVAKTACSRTFIHACLHVLLTTGKTLPLPFTMDAKARHVTQEFFF
jgi:hypothetical protein